MLSLEINICPLSDINRGNKAKASVYFVVCNIFLDDIYFGNIIMQTIWYKTCVRITCIDGIRYALRDIDSGILKTSFLWFIEMNSVKFVS